jgi:hypothetical protein
LTVDESAGRESFYAEIARRFGISGVPRASAWGSPLVEDRLEQLTSAL